MSQSDPSFDLDSAFTDDELLVLCHYLDVSPPERLDPWSFPEEVVEDPAFDHDWWEPDSALDRLGFTEKRHSWAPWWLERNAAAVGSILLQSAQSRLPQWGAWDGEKLVLGRRPYRPERTRKARVALFPRLLFHAGWKPTVPGISWDESYHLTWIPAFRRYVVTVSQSSIDLLGYCDVAIDAFRDDVEGPALVDSALAGVSTYWGYQESSDGWHAPSEVIEAGLVSRRKAEAMCRRGG